MSIIDVGSGPALVLVPGVQGRWEYLQPAIDALARWFRVVTFPLCGERDCDVPFDPALGLDNYTRQILTVLDRGRIDRAVICGISFGGLVAIRFASAESPRTAAVVLVSTPGPRWHLRPRHRVYARLPWIFGPLFFAETPFRLRPELKSAFQHAGPLWTFTRRQVQALIRSPLSTRRMAERAEIISSSRVIGDCRKIVAPTLLVTGERHLDRVVSVDGTLEYLRLIPGARHSVIERTGHLGSITRPVAFASLVRHFVFSSDEDLPAVTSPEVSADTTWSSGDSAPPVTVTRSGSDAA